MKQAWIPAALAACLLLAGCDALDADDDPIEQAYVVESYQVAGERLQPVLLSRTTPVNETYDFNALAVRGADVRVHLLDAAGAVEATYPYVEQPLEPGVYVAGDTLAHVQPLRIYALEVVLPNGTDRLAAQTVVPDTFSIVQANADTVVYQGPAQLALEVTRSSYPGRQTVFIFTTEALDVREEQLTPFAQALYEDGEVSLETLRAGASPILNEANYEVDERGHITIELPWLAVAFYGPNQTTASALDENLYDFIRSQSVQQGGSTLSPGEIPNVIEHVDGGTGVFGSLARVRYDVYIARQL